MNVIRPEKIDSIDEDENLAAVTEVEAGIRDFVRNDVAYLRRPTPGILGSTEAALEPNTEATVNNVNSLIQREISGYAQLSQAAMKSTRMIADNVSQWKRAADGLRNS